MNLKVLLIGANGFVGRRLARRLRGDIIGTYHSSRNPGLQQQEQLDITDAVQVSAVMRKHLPDIVIMPAAISSSRAPKDLLDKVNVLGVKNVLRAMQALQHPPYFIFFSSEQVFDGTRDLYRESDPVQPENDYGRSKAEAERLISQYTNGIILRLSLVVGKKEPGDHENFLSNMRKQDFVVFTDVYRMPLYVEDIPPIVQELMRKRYTGTLQIAGPDYLSFDQMADIVEKSWHLPRHTRTACPLANYPRKFNMSLDNMRHVLSYTPTPFAEAVRKSDNEAER